MFFLFRSAIPCLNELYLKHFKMNFLTNKFYPFISGMKDNFEHESKQKNIWFIFKESKKIFYLVQWAVSGQFMHNVQKARGKICRKFRRSNILTFDTPIYNCFIFLCIMYQKKGCLTLPWPYKISVSSSESDAHCTSWRSNIASDNKTKTILYPSPHSNSVQWYESVICMYVFLCIM